MKATKSNPNRASKFVALLKGTSKKSVPAELNRAVKKAAAILNHLFENELGGRYTLGVLVRDAMEDATYGDAALAAFAEKLHLDESTLRIHATVTRVWDEKEFKALAKRRGDTKPSYRLSWSHFVLLAGVEDGRTRNALISASFAEALSEKALRSLRTGRSESEGVTNPPSKRLDIVGAVRDIADAGSHLQSLLSDAAEGTAPTIEQLKKAEEALKQIASLLKAVQERIAQSELASAAATSPVPQSSTGSPVAEQRRAPGYQEPAPVSYPPTALPAGQAMAQLPFQVPFTAPADIQPAVRIVQAPAPVQSPMSALSNEALGRLKSQIP
ncbi:MAG: hypothetical protein IAE78_32720 [Myxococcus sp.]|nr:hypothetical protein [Myxococcus sp.]